MSVPKAEKLLKHWEKQSHNHQPQIGFILDAQYMRCLFCFHQEAHYNDLVKHWEIKHKESKKDGRKEKS